MAIDRELIETLDVAELKPLVASADGANARVLLERDLLYRRAEIELELSRVTAERDAAIASQKAAVDQIDNATRSGWHRARVIAAVLTLALAPLAILVSNILAASVLASWSSPFSSGWLPAAFWGAVYLAAIVVLWETDFFLRRLPARRKRAERDTDVAAHRRAVTNTEAARRKHLVELVRDHVTEIVNAGQGASYAAELRVGANPGAPQPLRLTVGVGLSEVTNDDNRVATDVQRRLMHVLSNLSGASIGVSGPRGVGKSTLLTALCGSNQTINGGPAIAICTSAPVEYEGREFLLHLFSSLCRQVLRTEGRPLVGQDSSALLEARRWRQASIVEALQSSAKLLSLAGLGLISVALFLAMLQSLSSEPIEIPAGTAKAPLSTASATSAATGASQEPSLPGSPADSVQQPSVEGATTPQPPAPEATQSSPDAAALVYQAAFFRALVASPLFTLGVLALVLGGVLLATQGFAPVRRLIFGPEPELRHWRSMGRDRIIYRAQDELRNIEFQRSYTSGWIGSLKVPIGLDLATSGGFTLAERAESLPELVERFRSFVGDVTLAYNNVVLIGIDELDKLKTAQQAEAFLNGVKSVFGIPRCFYLISVSEHALAAFERRGMGFRDAFDSALDDVVQLDFLNLSQARVLLNRRILRLHDPFLQICHMLSGGLPRDLIRHARALLDYAAEQPSSSIGLKEAVEHMAERDLAARLRATSIAIRTVKELSHTSALLVQIAKLPAGASVQQASVSIKKFRAHLALLAALRENEEGRVLLRFAEELAVYYEMMILLRRAAALMSTNKGWKRVTELGLADAVAGVRQALEVGVPLAEVKLAELRGLVDEGAAVIAHKVPSTSRAASKKLRDRSALTAGE